MHPAARLRFVYFLYYAYVGAFLPYFAPYLRGLGFSGSAIGAIQMVPSLLQPAVALSWAAWADRRGTSATALRRASAWAAAMVLLLPFARTPLEVGAVVLLVALGDRAVIPLVDSTALEHVRATPGEAYARIRLFGSLGFVAASMGMGWALTLRGSRPADPFVPFFVAACVAGYALAARRVPPRAAHPDRPGLADVAALARDRHLLLLLLACAIHWASAAPWHLFFGVHVRELGLTHGVTGLGMGAGVLAEIAALALFPRLEARFGLRALLAVAFAGTALRWLALAFATSAAAVVALQLLHFLTFGLFWGSAISSLSAAVPARLRTTGQALFSSVVFGLGNGLGYVLSGVGYDAAGAVAPLFRWAAAVELLPLALVLLAGAGGRPAETTRHPGGA